MNKTLFSSLSNQQIGNHCLNQSPSKQRYAFSKQQRFNEKILQCCAKSFYDLPDKKSQRSTTFGIGNRINLNKYNKNIDQPSIQYNIKSDFDTNQDQNKGVSFGKGKKDYNFQQKTNQNPGVGSYQIDKDYIKKSYSFRKKTYGNQSVPLFLVANQILKEPGPGPGQYNDISINKDGKYPISKHTNVKKSLFNPLPQISRYQRSLTYSISNIKQNNETINNNANQNSFNNYILSQNKYVGQPRFLQAKRELLIENYNQVPGPGSYKLPSEFGIYDLKIQQLLKKKNLFIIQKKQ